MEESEGQKEIEQITKTQPALLAFVMADSEDLSEDAQKRYPDGRVRARKGYRAPQY